MARRGEAGPNGWAGTGREGGPQPSQAAPVNVLGVGVGAASAGERGWWVGVGACECRGGKGWLGRPRGVRLDAEAAEPDTDLLAPCCAALLHLPALTYLSAFHVGGELPSFSETKSVRGTS